MSVSNTLRSATAAVLMMSVLTACGDDDATSPGGSDTIVDVASSDARLSTLVTALEAAELEGALEGTGPFTVFAPLNTAFESLPNGVTGSLLETGNREVLQDLLRYHVVPGRYTRDQLTDGLQLTTLAGESLSVQVGAGGQITVDGVAIIDADVGASNGVVHTVGSVLTQGLDLVQLASVTPALSSLVSAIGTAGLATALTADGSNLTVFAPNNVAFAALGDAAPSDPAVLAQVLQLHVVNGRNTSSMLSDGQTLTSLLGPELNVSLNGSTVQITGPTNMVNVMVADLNARNGVLHIIDAVLIP